MRFAILGFGRIAARVVALRPDVNAVLVRPGRVQAIARELPRTLVATHLEELLAAKPDVVVEAASADALTATAEPILLSGTTLIPLSVAAFTDDAFYERTRKAAAEGGGTLVILLSGAIGSLDAIAAARESGLESVTYRAVSPPHVYRATVVNARFALDQLSQRTLVWEGSAREAARAFPHNCNVTVGVALAGLGLDRTRVELFADPDVERSIQSVAFQAGAGTGYIKMASPPLTPGSDFRDLTAFSVVALLNGWRSRGRV